MSEESKGKLPQHFTTEPPPIIQTPRGAFVGNPAAIQNKLWPEAWAKNPELIKLATEHQGWLGHVTTCRLKVILSEKIATMSQSVGNAAVNKEYSDTQVRVVAAQLKQLVEIEKLILDTEKFVQEAV